MLASNNTFEIEKSAVKVVIEHNKVGITPVRELAFSVCHSALNGVAVVLTASRQTFAQ
jgi:hypothetical protein